MCVSDILAELADNSGRLMPTPDVWLARAAAFSSGQALTVTSFESQVSALVQVSPKDTVASQGLSRQPPFAKTVSKTCHQ